MNRLISMEQAREALALQGRSVRWVKLRLEAIAHARPRPGTTFQLFRLRGRWFTTEADLRRLLPELFAHEASDADDLRDRLERQAIELEALRRRLEAMENRTSLRKAA